MRTRHIKKGWVKRNTLKRKKGMTTAERNGSQNRNMRKRRINR
jgi:hypothetical protein